MESSGVIEQSLILSDGRQPSGQHRIAAMEGHISAGSAPRRPSIARSMSVGTKNAFDAEAKEPSRHDDANLLAELEAIVWSRPQKLAFAFVFVCLIGFAAYSYRESETQICMQAWTEGRDAGLLAAVDPIHNVPCPYHDSQTGEAWRSGFREGFRMGLGDRNARTALQRASRVRNQGGSSSEGNPVNGNM